MRKYICDSDFSLNVPKRILRVSDVVFVTHFTDKIKDKGYDAHCYRLKFNLKIVMLHGHSQVKYYCVFRSPKVNYKTECKVPDAIEDSRNAEYFVVFIKKRKHTMIRNHNITLPLFVEQ